MPSTKSLPKTKTSTPKWIKARADALVLLEVTEEQVERTAKIQHLLRACGSYHDLFEYLDGSDKPEARAVCKLRDRLTVEQFASTPFEAFCIAAQVPVKTMFGIIAAEVMDQGNKASNLLLRANHARVVQATIDRSLRFDGTADAKMLHQAAHFVPVPKNTTTIINGDVVAAKTTNVAVLPAVEDTGRRLNDRFMEMPMPAQIAAPLDVEDEDDGDEE